MAGQQVRANYGASLSPDATAFAHIVDDGGYPRAVQRFLRGWRASSSRDVVLPVEGPVTRVIHSADGHYLACEVAPEGGTRTQVWVVTTDPDDRRAWRIDGEEAGTAELVGWDGTQVATICTGEDGIGSSCLIDPASGNRVVLDRRSGGKLVDAWAGAALVRVGARGYHELIMLHGLTEIALLPSDPGSVTDAGLILDDHHPRRIRYGPTGEETRLYYPHKNYGMNSAQGYVRMLIRSDNGCEHARLLEVTATVDGVTYQVVAERAGCDLDEFAVSDDLSTVALLWNLAGRSELQILELTDNTLQEPIPLPGMVATELSISAGGSMVAMTVESPSMPRTVELVDPRSREWERIDREPSRGPVSGAAGPTLETITTSDGLTFTGWLYRPPVGATNIGALVYLHGGPEGQSRPGYNELFPELINSGITVFAPNVRGSGGFGRSFMHADDKEKRFGAIEDVADCARFLVDKGLADPNRVACAGWSYGGYLTLAALTFHPDLFAAGISICGMSDLGTFYRHTEPWIADAAYPKYGHPVNDRAVLEQLSPLRRVDALAAPLLVVHGAQDTNVPVTESEQVVDALRERGRNVRYLVFPDDGHGIVKRENRATLVNAVADWLHAAFVTARAAS
ncbi:alpha/beta hydrolase family protein [Mycobacterium sp.]|jgi:dipeptidyl aminopeptidase/acylaminoacyl peptidase|uniref:alpha/beta hydrolase family protein n=1 Tax=Mycobacterium sp. TaxID=1785 RepID=UPI002D437EBB|nr:alpha/beta fold hydrolase [Mycobacterium sp.]HZA11083.1 alpha/beta fold hydrolase [Mycobacterium sp.]